MTCVCCSLRKGLVIDWTTNERTNIDVEHWLSNNCSSNTVNAVGVAALLSLYLWRWELPSWWDCIRLSKLRDIAGCAGRTSCLVLVDPEDNSYADNVLWRSSVVSLPLASYFMMLVNSPVVLVTSSAVAGCMVSTLPSQQSICRPEIRWSNVPTQRCCPPLSGLSQLDFVLIGAIDFRLMRIGKTSGMSATLRKLESKRGTDIKALWSFIGPAAWVISIFQDNAMTDIEQLSSMGCGYWLYCRWYESSPGLLFQVSSAPAWCTSKTVYKTWSLWRSI